MKPTYKEALRTADIQSISEQINEHNNINADVYGYHAFELLLEKKDEKSKQVLEKVLAHPKWNPNYCLVDGISPLERAILRKREDIALKILSHPNFNGKITPRVIQMATARFSKKLKKIFDTQNQR